MFWHAQHLVKIRESWSRTKRNHSVFRHMIIYFCIQNWANSSLFCDDRALGTRSLHLNHANEPSTSCLQKITALPLNLIQPALMLPPRHNWESGFVVNEQKFQDRDDIFFFILLKLISKTVGFRKQRRICQRFEQCTFMCGNKPSVVCRVL